MATVASNVRVAVTGAIMLGGPEATTPEGTGTELTGWDDLGYLSEDSFEITPETSSEDLKAWQNGDVVRTVITEAKVTVKFTMIETKKETVELYWGSEVTQTETEGSWEIRPSAVLDPKPMVIDVIDGAELMRYWFAAAQVTEREALTGPNGEIFGYGVTVTCYPNEEGVTGKGWATALKSAA